MAAPGLGTKSQMVRYLTDIPIGTEVTVRNIVDKYATGRCASRGQLPYYLKRCGFEMMPKGAHNHTTVWKKVRFVEEAEV